VQHTLFLEQNSRVKCSIIKVRSQRKLAKHKLLQRSVTSKKKCNLISLFSKNHLFFVNINVSPATISIKIIVTQRNSGG